MSNKKWTRIVFITFFFFIWTSYAAAFSLSSLFNFAKSKPIKLHVVNHLGHKGPTRVKVGVYLLHIGKYDFQSGTTRMDFYLIFHCDAVCKDINFEIMNATNPTIKLAVKQKEYLVYRVQADLNAANNLRSYPFDNHTLEIVIENRKMTTDKMIFEVDPSITALDNDLEVIGFDVVQNWKADVKNHYYKVFQQTFSSYKFSVFIKRPYLAGILKGILPALIIMCCSFLALFMKINHLAQRLSIATSTLIAAVVFHLNLTASIPPLGYITYADMFMLINYIYLLLILVEVILTTYFIETKHHGLAERINIICAWSIPLLWFVVQITNWFIFNHDAF